MEVVNAPIFLGSSVGFSVTNGTQTRILVPPTPPMVMPAISGEVAAPYNATQSYAAVRQRVLLGGARILGGLIASTDGSGKSVMFYLGTHLATLGAGTHTITSQNILTIGGGVYSPLSGVGGINQLDLAENKIQVGDRLALFRTDASDADNMSANDGVITGPVTAVSATQVTVTGTPWTNDAGLDATVMVFKVALQTRKGVPANSGNGDSTVPVNLLGGTQETDLPAQPDLGRQIGAHNAWIVGLQAAASSLPASIDVGCSYARY